MIVVVSVNVIHNYINMATQGSVGREKKNPIGYTWHGDNDTTNEINSNIIADMLMF